MITCGVSGLDAVKVARLTWTTRTLLSVVIRTQAVTLGKGTLMSHAAIETADEDPTPDPDEPAAVIPAQGEPEHDDIDKADDPAGDDDEDDDDDDDEDTENQQGDDQDQHQDAGDEGVEVGEGRSIVDSLYLHLIGEHDHYAAIALDEDDAAALHETLHEVLTDPDHALEDQSFDPAQVLQNALYDLTPAGGTESSTPPPGNDE